MSEDDPSRRSAGGAAPLLEGYDDVSVIGRGGFAVVYRAWQSSFSRMVAVKVLSRQALDARSYRLFDRERVALGALSSHPNIVTVYDSGVTADGAPYLAMEYLPRGSLADRLERGRLDWQEAVRIGVKLAGALETAHRCGVLHRDIKPENVLMSQFGEPQLADFGIVRLLGSPQTRSLEVNLSIPFAPPEILDGADPSVRSDVYSLACTVHSLVWGRPSFLSEHQDQNSLVPLMVRIHAHPPPDLRPLDVPDAVCRVLERAMAKDPSDRPGSALEFGTELQAAEQATAVPVTSLPLAEPADVADSGERPATDPSRPTTRRLPAGLSPSTVRRPLPRLAHAGAAAVVVAVVAVGAVTAAVLSGGGGDVGPVAPPGLPSSTRAVSPLTTAPMPLPSHTRPLPSGFYVVPGFSPALAFSLDEGWRRLRDDRSELVELVRTDRPETALVSFFQVTKVVDPTRSFSSTGEARRVGAATAAPPDLAGWLTSHPRLTVIAGPVTLGRVSARRLDIQVRSPNATCAPGRTSCVILFEFRTTMFVLLPGNRNRFYVVQGDGTATVISVEAPAEQFDALAAETERFLSSLQMLSR